MSDVSRVKAVLAVSAISLMLGTACSTQIAGIGAKSGPSAFPASPTPTTPAPLTSTPSSDSGSTPASPGVTSSTNGGVLGAKLEHIAVQQDEVGPSVTISLIPGGADVTGEVTLDNCGFNFTTETFRLARRQYSAADPDTDVEAFSNELAAYDTEAHAALALAQWHQAAATCPTTPVKSASQDVPTLLTKVTHNDLNVPTLPVKSNAVTIESDTAPDSPDTGTVYLLTILQRKGVVLDILYFHSRDPISVGDLGNAMSLAAVSGKRLATLG